MPLSGVTTPLSNPRLLDTYSVYRRELITNELGMTKVSGELIKNVRGVVYPDGENKLDRRAESQSTVQTITIISRFALRTASKDRDGREWQPDIVIWKGIPFIAYRPERWTSYGKGFVEMLCTATDPVQLPPELRGIDGY